MGLISSIFGPGILPLMAKYSSSGGQSIADQTLTTLTGFTKVEDSNNAFYGTTGVFTCPTTRPGQYYCSSLITFVNYSYLGGVTLRIVIRKNGSVVKSKYRTLPIVTGIESIDIDDVLDLVSGDTVDFQVYQSSGQARSLNTVATENVVNIRKID